MPARTKVVKRGAAIGFLVWMTYATVEYVLCSVAAAASYSSVMFSPWHWKLTAWLALVYAAAGTAAGALCGMLAPIRDGGEKDADSFSRSGVILALVVAFLLNAAAEAGSLSASDLAISAIAGVLAVGFALNLKSKSWFEKIGRHIYTWLAIGILTAGPWITRPLLRFAALMGAVLISLAWARLKAGTFRAPSVARHAAGLFVLAAGAAAATAVIPRGVLHYAPAARRPAEAGVPNIVLITMDTVRADHLPLYGYGRNTAPNLSEFAAHATVFRHAIAASNMTLASHASIFTGLYAGAHGAHYDPPVYALGRPLATGIPTLAAMLGEHGYVTAGVVANFGYLGSFYGLDRGFQIYDARQPVPVGDSGVRLFLRNGVRKVLDLFGCASAFDRVTREAGEIDDAAFTLLNDISPGRAPFFLFLNYMDAHWPYLPPSPFDSSFPGKLKNFSDASYKRLGLDLLGLKRQIEPREREHLVSQYDGGIAYLDSQLGRLFARLKELGLYDNALIIVTSDHGENFGDRNLLQHGIAVYHDEVNIPLIVKYPHRNEAQRMDSLVSQVDIPPTILEEAKIPRPPSFAGQSLTQDVDADRYLFSEAFPPEDSPPGSLAPQFRRTQRAAFQRFQKLIESSTGKSELYDLQTDPEEQTDIQGEKVELAASLESALRDWAARLPKFGRGGATPEQVLKQLKSLGYVQ